MKLAVCFVFLCVAVSFSYAAINAASPHDPKIAFNDANACTKAITCFQVWMKYSGWVVWFSLKKLNPFFFSIWWLNCFLMPELLLLGIWLTWLLFPQMPLLLIPAPSPMRSHQWPPPIAISLREPPALLIALVPALSPTVFVWKTSTLNWTLVSTLSSILIKSFPLQANLLFLLLIFLSIKWFILSIELKRRFSEGKQLKMRGVMKMIIIPLMLGGSSLGGFLFSFFVFWRKNLNGGKRRFGCAKFFEMIFWVSFFFSFFRHQFSFFFRRIFFLFLFVIFLFLFWFFFFFWGGAPQILCGSLIRSFLSFFHSFYHFLFFSFLFCCLSFVFVRDLLSVFFFSRNQFFFFFGDVGVQVSEGNLKKKFCFSAFFFFIEQNFFLPTSVFFLFLLWEERGGKTRKERKGSLKDKNQTRNN